MYWAIGIYSAFVIIQIVIIFVTNHWINYAPFILKLLFIVGSPLFLPIIAYTVMQNYVESRYALQKELLDFIHHCEQEGIKFASKQDALDIIIYITVERHEVIFDIHKMLLALEEEGVVSAKIDGSYTIYKFINKI